ncbi:MAG TPA: apolipoprotein N-acyltransferase [Candidatus Polarisedimenticolaceae bacterium]
MKRVPARLAVALASAALFGAYAQFPTLAFLPYLALVPWILLYGDRRGETPSHVYYVLATLVAWMTQYTSVMKYGWFVPPVMALFYTPIAWAFTPLLARVKRLGIPLVIVVPVLWTAVEVLRARFCLAHFDLYALGYSQARTPGLAQIADVTGVWGLTFLVAAVNGWIADLAFAVRDARLDGAPVDWRPRIRSGAVLAAAFAVAFGYGFVRVGSMTFEDGPRLAVIQPNILHTLNNPIGTHAAQTIQTERAIPPGSADLIVWPENAILDRLDRPGAYLPDLKWLLERKGAWLLLGALGVPEGRPWDTTNAAILLDADGTVRGQYDKQVLYPWSEYVPLDRLLGAISTPLQRAHRGLIRKAWGYLATGTPGRGMSLLRIPWRGDTIPFAVLICVENTYPPVPAEAGRLGARFFVNITSEGEVGGVVQEQLLRISMLRAIENRIAYVRCGNTGISGFIDPAGRLTALLRGKRGGTISVAGSLTAPVPLSDGRTTLYARSRDAFGWGCVLATALWIVLSFRARLGPVAAIAILAPALAGCGGPDPAIAAARAACEEESACRQALPSAMQAWLARRSPEAAADFFGSVAQRWPSLEGDARAMRSYFLDEAADSTAALAEARRSVEVQPNARNLAMLGRLLMKRREPAAAAEVFARAIARDPSDARIHEQRVRAVWWAGDAAWARREAETLVLRAPRYAPAWSTLALLRFDAGDTAGALEAAGRALESDPANLEARLVRVRAALGEGRIDDAEAVREEIARIEAGLGRAPRRE